MFYPIKLDKMRNLRYGMKAISLIEETLGKPVMQIEGIDNGGLTMHAYAVLIWAGLVHEDKDLTPDKVIDLVDEYSSIKTVTEEMWKAFNGAFKSNEGKEARKNSKGAAEKNLA